MARFSLGGFFNRVRTGIRGITPTGRDEEKRRIEEEKRKREEEKAKRMVALNNELMDKLDKLSIDAEEAFGDLSILKNLLDEITYSNPEYKDVADELYEDFVKINKEANAKFEKSVNELVDDIKENPDRITNSFNQYYSPSISGTSIEEYIEAVYRAFKDKALKNRIRAMDFKMQLNFMMEVRPWEVYMEITYMGRKSKVFRPAREIADLAMSRSAVIIDINYTSGRTTP